MKPSSHCFALLRELEGLSLVAYDDGGGVWTIGYGHTGGVKPGERITKEQAEAFLESDAGIAGGCVNDLVEPSLEQNEFDALVSFVFNVGCGGFRTSALLRLLNERDMEGAAEQFSRWVYQTDRRTGKKTKNRGLISRRAKETALFTATPNLPPVEVPPIEVSFKLDTAIKPVAPPTKVTQTTTGKFQVGAIASGGVAAVVAGVQNASPLLQSIQQVTALTAGWPQWLRAASSVLVLGSIACCAWTVWHKRGDVRGGGR